MKEVLLNINRFLCVIIVGCIIQSCTDSLEIATGNTTSVLEVENIMDNDTIRVDTLSPKIALPKVLVSCVNPCIYDPLTVTFTSPNYAQIGNRGPIYDALINPLFVTEDDKFQVFAKIAHGGCQRKHTVIITNGADYTETIYSGTFVGIIDYRGYVPLARKSDTERIVIQLFNY